MKRLPLAALALIAASPLAAQEPAPRAPMTEMEKLQYQRDQQLFLDRLASDPQWHETEGGVLWRRISGDGSGQHPTVADTVMIHYTGMLIDGTVFDSTATRGFPATFPLGRLIKAWQVAIPEAGVGDTIEIAVPASMGYGTKGAGPIPGGATLLFTVQLIGIAIPE